MYSFSKIGTRGKLSKDGNSCHYNNSLPDRGKYTALLSPAVGGDVCIVVLNVDNGDEGAATEFGMAPADADLEKSLHEQKSICVERNISKSTAGSYKAESKPSSVWIDMQEVAESGFNYFPIRITNPVLLVWRKGESPYGEWALFTPKHNRNCGCVDGKPIFRPVPDGCTHFAVTGREQVRFTVNHKAVDEAKAALKAGDAEFVAYLFKKWSEGPELGCCVVA